MMEVGKAKVKMPCMEGLGAEFEVAIRDHLSKKNK